MIWAVRGHRIEVQPTQEHELYFRKACGVTRFAFNWGLAEWKKEFTAGNKPNWMSLKKKLNQSKAALFPWMYEVTKCAPEGALANLGAAWANYFRDVKKSKGQKAQKPKFKKKGKCEDKFYLSNDQFSVCEKAVNLPHIGLVKMTENVRFQGKIMGAVVSREADRWFISIQVETDVTSLKHEKTNSVGIDLGIDTEITLSSGQKLRGPKPLRKRLIKLARLNRSLHRKVKDSHSRAKAALRLARFYRKISNIRKDFIHKITTRITQKFGVICLEDLNTAGMLKNHKLARAISESSFHEVKRQIEYKAGLRGGQVIYVDRFFPSSKKCRKCGTLKRDLELKDRTFTCSSLKCGHIEDRDIHAARNILKESTLGRSGIHAGGHQTSIPTKSRKRFSGRKSGGLKPEKCIKTQDSSILREHV